MQLIGKPSSVVVVNPKDLIPHPKNDYFFPAPAEEEDREFRASIAARGIINMPVITDQNVIISGHRRIKAAVDCGYEQIQCQQRTYENEDMATYDLLASNLMSRGGVGYLYTASPVKAARVVTEFARLYGNAGNRLRENESPIGMDKSVKEMTAELGISRSALGRSQIIARIEDDVANELDGKVSSCALEAVGRLLTPYQQRELIRLLPENYEKMTMQQFQCRIDEILGYEAEINALNEDLERMEERLERSVRKVAKLEEMNAPNANLSDEIERRQELEVQTRELKAKVADLKIKLQKNEKTKEELDAAYTELERAKARMADLEAMEPVTVEVEVMPADYEKIKQENMELRSKILELKKMDSVAGFAMANIQSLRDMAAGVENEELNAQVKNVETAMRSLIDCVGKLKKGA